MGATEIVAHREQRHGTCLVLDLLAGCAGQPASPSGFGKSVISWTCLRLGSSLDAPEVKGGNRRATSWGQVVKVKIFDLSWNVDLNRLENEINDFLATLPSNAVKHVQSTASSTRTRDTDQMQTDYLVTVWYEGGPKKTCSQEISAAVK